MKRILIILLVLIAILSAGGYFLFKKAITPEALPANIVDAEEAIAAPGTIAIASVDMTYLRRVDKLLNPEKDPSPLPATTQAKDKSLLDKLKQQGIDLVANTDYALGAINIAQEKPAHSLVLFGRYSGAALEKALGEHYSIEKGKNGYLLLTENVAPVTDPCIDPAKIPAPKQQALQLRNDRILLSSPEMMPLLLKRFSERALSGVPLGNWRAFKKEKAVAAAVIKPAEAKKGAVDFPSSLMLGGISSLPLKEIHAGAVISFLPEPGYTFHIDAHANEAGWPLEAKTEYDAWLTEALLDLQQMPTVTALIKSLAVQADGNVLRVKTLATNNTLDNLGKIPGELIQMAFAGLFGGEIDKPVGEEQIVKDEEIEQYLPQFDFSSIVPFDEKSTVYKPDFLAGPLAIRLKKIGLFAVDDSIIELEVNAEGKGFDNLASNMMHRPGTSPVAGLSITSVEDKEGNNLLREEQCGDSRNSVAASLSTIRDKELKDNVWISKAIKVQGSKTVRLKPDVVLSQVAKIKGQVAVQAATKTRVETLKAPFARKVIKTDQLRMYFRKNTPGTVKYTISGDTSKILAVRAKNAKGQYLASAGSSASGNETKMVSKFFKGKVASVEVVMADELQTKEYPFEISQVVPRYGKRGDGTTQVDLMVTAKQRFLRKHRKMKYRDDECKDKQKIRTGAFLVCMGEFGEQAGQQVGGAFDVFAPYDETLQNDVSAGMLSIDSVITDDGKEIKFNKKAPVDFDYKFEMTYNDKKKQWDVVDQRLHGSYVRLFSDNEALKNKKISKVKGTLVIRLPKRTNSFNLSARNLGVVEKSRNGIYANIVAFEDWNTYIDLRGPVNKVMRFLPYAKDGKVLNTANERIYEKQYHTIGLSKEDKEKIKKLPKKSQGILTIYGEPEIIKVIYADNFETIRHKFEFVTQ